MAITSIHKRMRRCLLLDDGQVQAYLDADDSHNLTGQPPSITGTAAAGTTGLTLKGSGFGDVVSGQYVHNKTDDTYFYIKTVTDSATLELHYALGTTGTNWGDTTSTTASKLVDSGADFVSAGIQTGMIAALRDLSDYAVITAIDDANTLSVSKDIFPIETAYTIMKAVDQGDEYEICTGIFDGSKGQVMVEIPRYWLKYDFASDDHSWLISSVPRSGYSVHPAFKNQDGTEKNYIYIGAFEGVVDDFGFGDGTELTDYNLGTTKLASLPGLRPVVGGQRSEFRTVSGNRGAQWHQISWFENWAWQLLLMAELVDLDSQTALDEGITTWSSTDRDNWAVNTDNRSVIHAGYSMSAGNATLSENTTGGNASGVLSYRGIENPYGQIWKWLDGVNYNDGRVYLSHDAENFSDDTGSSPYFDTGFNQPTSNGYISKIHPSRYGLIPAEAGGSGSTYIPDYYWYVSGWRVALAGGAATYDDQAGFAALIADRSSASRITNVGARLCFG